MRLAFISDIHGNALALDAVLNDIQSRNVDKIAVLGDFCFRGPEPKRSLELVRKITTDVLKGNADEWVVRGVDEGEVPDAALEIMKKEREWSFSKLDDEAIDYLKNLPTELNFQHNGVNIHAFHATPDSLFEIVKPDDKDETIVEKLMKKEADIYIYAHIHKPFIRFINGKCIINTGSVGLPFDGQNKSSYALIDIGEDDYESTIVRVSYDVQKVIKQFDEMDYPNSELMITLLEQAKV